MNDRCGERQQNIVRRRYCWLLGVVGFVHECRDKRTQPKRYLNKQTVRRLFVSFKMQNGICCGSQDFKINNINELKLLLSHKDDTRNSTSQRKRNKANKHHTSPTNRKHETSKRFEREGNAVSYSLFKVFIIEQTIIIALSMQCSYPLCQQLYI